jgi:uncharacterized membrane protein
MVGRIVLAIFFIVAGGLHFLVPQNYLKVMPPYLPAPLTLVRMSGAAEILGGLGLFAPSTRRAAAWGVVALLIAVLPVHLFMVIDHASFASIPLWALWLRLPLQLPLIYWAWLYARRQP